MGTESQETNNQAQQTEPEANKTFTQAEVDLIVKERLGRERAKYEGFEEYKEKAAQLDKIEEANKTELQKAQEEAEALQKAQDKAAELEKKLSDLENANNLRAMREKVASEKGVPIDLLTGETEEACNTQADGILKFASAQGYPVVRDNGEPSKMSKPSTREQFKEFMDASFK